MQNSVEYAGYAEYAKHAEKLTADGAYQCPVGSIWLFFFCSSYKPAKNRDPKNL